jgi:hypothetical protein
VVARACGCSRLNCKTWPTKPACPFRFAVTRQALRSGTRHVPAKAGIEHKLFSHITKTWQGKPLVSRETVVELIASATTKTGLAVCCELDTRLYSKGIKVSDEEMATLNIKGDTLHHPNGITTSTDSATLKRQFLGVA